MAQWVNSYEYLDKAILDATKNTIEKTLIESEIKNAWNSGGIDSVINVANKYGVQAGPKIYYGNNQSYIPFWNVEKVATEEGITTVYQNSLTVDVANSIDDKIILKNIPEKTTKFLSKGAVQNAVKFASIMGAVATGVGLGVKSYKDNPVMWTELSNALFDLNGSEFFKVLSREYNGQYKTFIREEDVANVIKTFAYKDVFNVNSIISNIPSGTPNGTMDTNFSRVGVPDTPSGIFAYNYYLENFSDYDIIMYVDRKIIEDNQNITFLYCAKHQDLPTSSYVKKDLNGTYYTDLSNIRFISAKVDNTTGQLVQRHSDVRQASIVSGYRETVDSKTAGGLNATVTQKQGNNPIFYYPENTNALENITSDMSVTDILDKLKSKYNNWFDDNFEITGYNPETSEFITENFIPLTLPTQDPTIQDINDNEYNQEYVQKGIPKQDNNLQTETLLNNPPKVEPIPSPDDTPNDNGGGIIGGSGANGLWSVYNPTKEELNNLGAYLWSSNIIEILQKFLNNPMDCIISLHLIYGTPTTGNNQNIKLGYLDSGVSSKVVTEQFINIDCGSLFINEYYGDSRDYEDIYTQIECFLPFIGFVKLQSSDIINSKVNIKYVIDVLSGVITAKIYITKNGATQQLYTYSGDCSIQIPLTSSDRTRLLSGAITGAIGGFATGGVAGAIIGGGIGSYMGGSNITKSGNFNGNSGALNVKKPYIIISRKIPYDANNYNKLLGYPSNENILLKNCNGFTRVKECFTDNIINATYSEKNEIKELLKNGIII